MTHCQTVAIAAFQCLGDACPDTCCQGWSMQLDAATLAKYREQAPELLDAVVLQDVPEGSVLPASIMRRDSTTDKCVKLESGWCGIHRARGSDFLGDACHFYPRVLRRFDDRVTMTGALSCPEIARLMLLEDIPAFAWKDAEFPRLPHAQKSYAPEGVSADAALAAQQAFLDAVAESPSPRAAVLLLHSAAQSLDSFAPQQWPETVPMALKFAASRIPAAESHPADALNVLLALSGLMQAAQKSNHARLRPMVERIEQLLACRLQWERMQIDPTSATQARLDTLKMRVEMLPWFAGFMRRWLQAQLSIAAFPFAGFGTTLTERIAIIGVRMATLTLAILARAEEEGDAMSAAHAADEVQVLARFLDHLAEPEYSVQIYTETGWIRPARLRGLLESLAVS
jgi:lysine-N-methylase